jgi:hypothetical protein
MPTNTSKNSIAVDTQTTLHPAVSGSDFEVSLDRFKSQIDELVQRFGKPKTSVIKSVIENACEYRARYEIEAPITNVSQKFDSYFRIKHEFQKNRFVQRLCLELKQRGLQTFISTEEKHAVGIFDVLITNAPYLIRISDKSGLKKIVIEWKSSSSFSLSQLERYLWTATTVVLVRAHLGQVVRISRKEIEQYMIKSLIELTERSTVISSGQALQKIPGPYCKGCPVKDCEFFKAPAESKKIISFGSDSMREDLLLAFNKLDQCIEQVIDVVIKELIN